jgi:hypothetical protein
MAFPLGRCLRAGLVPALLLAGLACKRPETALRERPAQRIELVQTVEGMTPEEAKVMVAQVSEGLGLPPSPPAEAGEASIRVLRLTLTGRPDRSGSWGMARTCLTSMGEGALLGGLLGSGLPFYVTPTSWKGPGIGAGVGLVCGAVYGPLEYRKKQATLQELGYLPWRFQARWEVLDRQRGHEEVAARSREVYPDLRPLLHPVLEGADRAGRVRRENLAACAADLARRIQGRKAVR